MHNNPLTNIDPTGHYCVSADGRNAHGGSCSNSDSYYLGSDEYHVGKPYIVDGTAYGSVNSDGSYTDEPVFVEDTTYWIMRTGDEAAAKHLEISIKHGFNPYEIASGLDSELRGTMGSTKGNVSYSRPTSFRKGVRDEVWERSKDENGEVRDPLTGKVMNPDEPWDMGHKPGHEFRKHQQSAKARGISRKQFLDEYNNPGIYRPELPSSNRSHKGEDMTDDYFGP